MRILHLMLSNFYIDNANYQENALPRQNKKDGHEVMIIASTEIHVNNLKRGYTKPGNYINEDGIPVIRIPYDLVLTQKVSQKIRSYPNLYKYIGNFSPDVIFFHGIAAFALITVAKYKKNNPGVRFFVDSHADFNNSATNLVSKLILHKLFYKTILRRSLKYIDKIFYITHETFVFLRKVYGISEMHLQFLPLGGFIPEVEKRQNCRKDMREQMNIKQDEILLIHSGKLGVRKRTLEILQAFTEVKNKKLRLIIAGSMDEEVFSSTINIINSDPRITYLGWLNSNVLQTYLCASDLYVQLGTQSATMQNAICCGCAAALYPFESHKHLLKDSVFYIKNSVELANLLKKITSDRSILEGKRKESFMLAEKILDYAKISATIYNVCKVHS